MTKDIDSRELLAKIYSIKEVIISGSMAEDHRIAIIKARREVYDEIYTMLADLLDSCGIDYCTGTAKKSLEAPILKADDPIKEISK